jgi:hypothetical protein
MRCGDVAPLVELCEAVRRGGARVRLAVMSSHARPELIAAAQALGRAAERGATGFFDAESRLAA